MRKSGGGVHDFYTHNFPFLPLSLLVIYVFTSSFLYFSRFVLISSLHLCSPYFLFFMISPFRVSVFYDSLHFLLAFLIR